MTSMTKHRCAVQQLRPSYFNSIHTFEALEPRRMLAFSPLQPGDANRDGLVDEVDLIQVLKAGKYLTGEPATWEEGDWNGSPGGKSDNPPNGDGVFNQLDEILAVLLYGVGPYTPNASPVTADLKCVTTNGGSHNGQSRLEYDQPTGSLSIHAGPGIELTSILIESESGLFTGKRPRVLSPPFDVFTENRVFTASFGDSFRSMDLGSIVEPGTSLELVLSDIRVDGSLAGGGTLDDVGIRTDVELGPRIIGEIEDIRVATNSSPLARSINLHEMFQSRSSDLVFDIAQNTNSDLVTATIDHDGRLDLSVVPDRSGTTFITVRASSSFSKPLGSCSPAPLTAEQTFQVTVESKSVPGVPGDANGDGQFDQLDIVQVLQAGKYRSGESATFAEGDFNGDNVFDQWDIVVALQSNTYLRSAQAVRGFMDMDGNGMVHRNDFVIHEPESISDG